jgi:hypothetical protein
MKKPKNLLIIGVLIILTGIFYKSVEIPIRDYFFSQHVLYWNKNIELKKSDFQDEPEKKSESETYLYFGLYLKSTNLKDAKVIAYFDKNQSWLKDSTNFKEKMELQKLRFDLYEIYARKFNKEIDKIKFKEDKSFRDLEEVGEKIYEELSKTEDSLYNHNMLRTELIEFWRPKINKMLERKN